MTDFSRAAVLDALAAQLDTVAAQVDAAKEALRRDDTLRSEVFVNAAIATLRNMEHAIGDRAKPANVVRLRPPSNADCQEATSEIGLEDWLNVKHDSETKK